MDLSFVPRNVAKSNKPKQLITTNKAPPVNSSTEKKLLPSVELPLEKNLKANLSDEDVLIYLWLSLSNYAISLEKDLLKTFLWNLRENDGWTPINNILRRSQFLGNHLESGSLTEKYVVKALRAEPDNGIATLFDLRMRLAKEPTSSRTQIDTSSDTGGSYDLRLRNSPQYPSDTDWESQTLYVENIPIQDRSIPCVYRLLNTFLNSQTTSTPPNIQHIYFPAHHQDRQEVPRVRKCKGFCFVIFSDSKIASQLHTLWPWIPTSTEDSQHSEAIRFGFRTLPKAEYQKLQTMYEEYRHHIVDDIAASQDNREESFHPTNPVPIPEPAARFFIDPTAAFPPNCLLFLKNVHAETNKTTLRKLLAPCLDDPSGIDYVDYTKGLDSCHVRLSHPKYASRIVTFFNDSKKIQSHGLDDVGSLVPRYQSSIEAELVVGRKEDVYWQRVPEKVRKTAVLKLEDNKEEDDQSNPRKRRKW